MTQQLRRLRNEVTADTTQYVRALSDAERAAEKLGEAAADLGRQVEATDKKTVRSAAGFEAVKRQIDPLYAAQERLKKSMTTLQTARDLEKIDDAELARLKALLTERYDLAGQAAARAAKAQADAARAATEAAAAEAAGLARLRGRYDENYTAAEKYNTALAELATLQRAGALSGQSLAEAQAKIERELNPVNVALAKQKAALDQIRSALDPAAASARRLEEQERTLRAAFESGTISGLEYDSMLRKLRAGHDDAAAGARKTGTALREVMGEGAREAAAHAGFAGDAIMALGRAGLGAVAGIAAAGVAVAALVAASIPAAGEFQKLQASLRTVGGSAQLAAAEFEMIKEFALQTPMSVEQVTAAFIKLKAMGLDPSMASLRSYGNTASAMGKSVQDMVEAVADATTGEFERLKEFGIKSAVEGNKVTFTFQGIKTSVANNATEIQKYLLSIGNTKFASGMEEQSNTLSGAIDNLSDNWQIFLANVGNSGPVQAATALIRALADAVSGLNSMLFPSIKEQITAARGEVETLRREIAEMEKFPDAYGPELEGRRAVLIEREKSLKVLEKEQAEREKLIKTTQNQATVTKEVDEAAKKELERRLQITNRLDIEYDERARLLEATKQGKDAVIALNRELEGERAIREFLGVTSSKEALQKMEGNKLLTEQARRVQEVARQNYDLKIATDAVTESQKAADEARKKAEEEAKRNAEKFAEDIKRTSEKISLDVAENLYDSLMDPDKSTSVLDFFKSMFKRIAVEAIAAKVILPITTQIVSAMPDLFGISGGPSGSAGGGGGGFTGMVGSLAGMGGMFPGAQASTLQFMNTPMWGSTANGTEALVNRTGSINAAHDTPANIAQGSGISASGPTWGQAAGSAVAGAAVGGAVGSTVGNATGSKAAGAASGAISGAMAGAAGGPVGMAVGAVLGGIMGALGTAGKPSNMEGNATYSLGSGRTSIGGQTGDKYSAENRSAAQQLAEGLGAVGKALGNYSGRDLQSSLKIAVGSRDGLVADVNGKTARVVAGDTGKLGRFVINEFANQIGDALPKEIASALARTDWTNLEEALADISFGAEFLNTLDSLGKDMGLVDAATKAAKDEVRALTEDLMGFRETSARLGLDTNAANDATRRYVEGLLGMREVAAPMTDVEQAVAVAKVRFAEIVPLLEVLGINADEAAKALERTITAMREDFIGGLEREFNQLTGRGWIDQIEATFDIMDERLRNAAALGGGSDLVLRNNHIAIQNILEALEDPALDEAAARYGGAIAAMAQSIKESRVVLGEAAPAVEAAVLDSAKWMADLTRQLNELSGNGYINQVSDQFAALNANLAIASQVGFGSGEALAANHLAMQRIMEALSDDQLGAAAERFGGGIRVIADAIRAARLATEQADFIAGVIREGLDLSGAGYVNSINDQFAKMNDQLATAQRVGAGYTEVLSNNHLAMQRILSSLTDDQLRDAAARFGGGIRGIADSLLAGRAATQAATAAQEAATAAQQAAASAAAQQLEEANARVAEAREAVQRAFAAEISSQREIASAANAAAQRMRDFADSFKEFRDSLLTGDLSPLSPEGRYNAAKSQFEDLARRAAAGDPDAMSQLQGSAGTFLQASRDYNASGAGYSRDFDRVQSLLASAERTASREATAAEAQAKAAERQAALLERQLSALLGTQETTKTIAQAIKDLQAALLAQSRASAAVAGGGGGGASSAGAVSSNPGFAVVNPSGTTTYGGITMTGTPQEIAKAYVTHLGRTATLSEISYWENQTKTSSLATTLANIKNSPEAQKKLASGKALGGMVSGGIWNMDSVLVPLAGGEHVTRAPAVNASTIGTLDAINRTGKPPANDDSVKELRGLRDELRALVRISAAAGDDNSAGLASLDKRLGTLERKGRLAAAS